jgi:hypothetical protein
MTKLAFVDTDGVIANCEERFSQADAVADAQWGEDQRGSRQWEATKWSEVFRPDLVGLDTLISSDIPAQLDRLESQVDQLIIYTSRPEAMREATQAWLMKNHCWRDERQLLMKHPALQYVKTVIWVAGSIQQLARMRNATEVIVVDDEEIRRNELTRYNTPFILRRYASLELQEPETEDDLDQPF